MKYCYECKTTEPGNLLYKCANCEYLYCVDCISEEGDTDTELCQLCAELPTDQLELTDD